LSVFDSILIPIHREGHRFVALFALASALFFMLAEPLGWIGVVLTLGCAYFFRDPARVSPQREGLIISPADGLVLSIERALPPQGLGMGDDPRLRICIFMSVLDVHVNRAPATGTVTALAYHSGAFFNASLDKASEQNERQAVRMTTSGGKDIAFVQIAGLIARRIVCHLAEGQTVKAGERFGIIRFGSRLDVYLDEGMNPLVLAGQRAVAGETVLADQRSKEAPRKGEVQ
jgi:phosphatidylserine decarboxylase